MKRPHWKQIVGLGIMGAVVLSLFVVVVADAYYKSGLATATVVACVLIATMFGVWCFVTSDD